MKTAIHIIEDRLKDDLGIGQGQARHTALHLYDDLTAGGFNIVAGPPEGFRLVLQAVNER